MKRLNVSKKDLKLLIILVSLVILYLTYQFIYTKNMDQVELLNADISSLEARVSELQIKVDQGDAIRAENEDMEQEFDTIVKSYGNGASEEKSIMMVKALEDIADMSISTATFSQPEYFFNGTNMVESEEQMTGLDAASAELDAATGNSDTSGIVSAVDAEQLTALDQMSGYKNTISITFRVSYDGLKQCVDFINEYYEKCNVGDVSLSYDTETGMLSGSMIINQYHLSAEDIIYQPPIMTNQEIGTDNIFGTIVLQDDGNDE